MDIEKIIVKYMADATQFNQVTDATEKRLELFATNMTGLGRRIFEVVAGGVVFGLQQVTGRVGDLLQSLVTKVSNTYQKLESRYGKNWARAIIGVGVAGLAVPLPAASLLLASPVIALAELAKKLAALKIGARIQFGVDYAKAFLGSFWETTKEGLKDLLGRALTQAAVPLGIGVGVFNSVRRGLQPVTSRVSALFADMWQGVVTGSFFQGRVGQAIGTAFQNLLGGTVATRISSAFAAVLSAPIVQAIPGVVMAAARRSLSGVQSLLGGAFGAGRFAAGAVGNTALSVVGTGASVLASLFSGGAEMLLGPLKLGLLAVGAAAVYAGYEAVRMAADFENATVSFKVMTGSAERAKDLLEELTKLGIETPFKSGELIKQAQTLKAYGVETEDLVDTLRTLGDVASGGSGGSLDERLGRLVLAFGQTRSQGKLMGQELRQFANAGVPLIESLAKVVGRPVPAVRGLVEAGRIGTREVAEALNLMTGPSGQFFNLMEERSKTVEGRWSAFVENIQVGLRNLGLSFFKGFGLADLLDKWGSSIQGVGRQTEQLEEFFRRLREVFDMVTTAVSALATIIGGGLTQAIEAMTGAMPDWSDVRSSIDLIVQVAIVGFGRVLDLLKQVAKAVAPILKAAGEAAMLVGMDPDTGKARSVYSAARKDDKNVIESLFISGGAGLRDLVLGTDTRQELVNLGKVAPRINPFQGAVTGLENFANDPSKPSDEILKEYKRMREAQEQQAAAARAGSNQGWLMGLAEMAGKAGGPRGGIPVHTGPSAEAMKMIGEVNKAFAEGESPIAKFHHELDALNSALKSGFPDDIFQNLKEFGMAPESLLSQREQEFQAGKILDQLRSAAGSMEMHFPAFATRGSAEAQDTVNRSMFSTTKNIQEEIHDLYEMLKTQHEERMRDEKEALETLKSIDRKAPVGGEM